VCLGRYEHDLVVVIDKIVVAAIFGRDRDHFRRQRINRHGIRHPDANVDIDPSVLTLFVSPQHLTQTRRMFLGALHIADKSGLPVRLIVLRGPRRISRIRLLADTALVPRSIAGVGIFADAPLTLLLRIVSARFGGAFLLIHLRCIAPLRALRDVSLFGFRGSRRNSSLSLTSLRRLIVGRALGAWLFATLALSGFRAGLGLGRHLRLNAFGRGALIVLRVFLLFLRRGDDARRYDRDGGRGRKQLRFHSSFLHSNGSSERLAHQIVPFDGLRDTDHENEMSSPDSPNTLLETILALCLEAGPTRTICPTDAAKAFARARGEDALGWRNHLQNVRAAAVRLADEGRIVIYRKGKPVDPHAFRGVYRLGAPRDD
jgi:hypothetical protein